MTTFDVHISLISSSSNAIDGHIHYLIYSAGDTAS